MCDASTAVVAAFALSRSCQDREEVFFFFGQMTFNWILRTFSLGIFPIAQSDLFRKEN